MTEQLMEQQRVEDAIAFLLKIRAPVIVEDLNFSTGTWRDEPVNTERLAEIVASLSDDEAKVIRFCTLLIQWGRQYERNRMIWGDEDDDDDEDTAH